MPAKSPEARARKLERMRERYANDPAYRERNRERAREWERKRRADPAYREWHREWHREWKRERRADPAYREREREQQRERYANDPAVRARALISGARLRSHKKGLPFDLDEHVDEIDWAFDIGRCQLTGVPFDFSSGRTWRSPSLDRIVPELGYIHGNVRVVCWGANSALGEWGLTAFKEMVCSWARFDPDVGAVLRAVLDGSSTTTNEGEEDDGDEGEEPQGRVQAVPVLRRDEEAGAEAEG